MRFHHLGIACADLDAALAELRRIHPVLTLGEVVHDPLQGASLRMLETADGLRLELVAGEAVAGLLRRGVSYYHVCFEVDDFDAESARLRATGAMPAGEAQPAVLFGGRRVRFFLTATGLVELLEAAPAAAR